MMTQSLFLFTTRYKCYDILQTVSTQKFTVKKLGKKSNVKGEGEERELVVLKQN